MTAEKQNVSTAGAGLLVCIPTYNEKENIEAISRVVLDAVPEAHVIIVDDNSPDGTGEIADRLAAADSRIKVMHRTAKQGMGRAYIQAFKWALENGYERVVTCDADFSHKPIYLPEMLKKAGEYDLVIGSRRVAGGGTDNWGPHRRLISWGGSLYARSILGVGIKDLTGGFNMYSRRLLETVGLDDIVNIGFGFQIEIKYRSLKKGFKAFEVPIIFPDRQKGTSKMSTAIFLEAMLSVWKIKRLVK